MVEEAGHTGKPRRSPQRSDRNWRASPRSANECHGIFTGGGQLFRLGPILLSAGEGEEGDRAGRGGGDCAGGGGQARFVFTDGHLECLACCAQALPGGDEANQGDENGSALMAPPPRRNALRRPPRECLRTDLEPTGQAR